MGRSIRYESERVYECAIEWLLEAGCELGWNAGWLPKKLGECRKDPRSSTEAVIELPKVQGKYKGGARDDDQVPSLSVWVCKGSICKEHLLCDLCDKGKTIIAIGLTYSPKSIDWVPEDGWSRLQEQHRGLIQELQHQQGGAIERGVVSLPAITTILDMIEGATSARAYEVALAVCAGCAKGTVVVSHRNTTRVRSQSGSRTNRKTARVFRLQPSRCSSSRAVCWRQSITIFITTTVTHSWLGQSVHVRSLRSRRDRSAGSSTSKRRGIYR
jgi:hypothetical protein